jgi:hypothetical protein
VAIYERLPGFAKAKHLGVARLRAVLGLPGGVQERLLRVAETEHWSKERHEERAARELRAGPGAGLRFRGLVGFDAWMIG